MLDGLSFEVQRGEIFGLLGPSGAGKTTTQRLLLGLQPGFSGRARVFGQPVDRLRREFYERIGVSFELPALYLRLTAVENLQLFASLFKRPTKRPMAALRLVGLEDDAFKRVETFSKGMKMRLNLCRALLNDPELLFLDEPTASQDPARARETRQLILKLKDEGKTVFLNTHNMAEADEICDRVGFLVNGRADIQGTPECLKREYGRPVLEVRHLEGQDLALRTFPMDGLGQNSEFLMLLQSSKIVTMHTQEASLDDVFIKVAAAATG